MGYINQQHFEWDADVLLPETPKFFGPDLEAEDIPRLHLHLQRVLAVFVDQKEHTLSELAAKVGCSQCSASARVRDLRRYQYAIEKRKDETVKGLWWYRLEV